MSLTAYLLGVGCEKPLLLFIGISWNNMTCIMISHISKAAQKASATRQRQHRDPNNANLSPGELQRQISSHNCERLQLSAPVHSGSFRLLVIPGGRTRHEVLSPPSSPPVRPKLAGYRLTSKSQQLHQKQPGHVLILRNCTQQA